MARLALSFVAFLFLFTFSHARDLQFPDSDSNSGPVSASEPQQHDTVSLSLESIDPVPLTILSFRPIDRRHVRPRRPCHHRREINYGNDAIVLTDASNGDRRPFLRSHSAVQRLPEMLDRRDDVHNYRRHHAHGHHHHHGWFSEKVRDFMNMF